MKTVTGPDEPPVTADALRTGRRRMTRAAREQQLLDLAEELFLANGYERTTIEDIARAAGVTRPVVYEHYGSKEGILLACVRRARRQFDSDLMKAVAGTDDPLEQLRRGADAYYRLLERDPRRWQLLFGPGGVVSSALGEELTRERFRTVNLLADLFEAHLPGHDQQQVDAFAHASSGSAEQLGHWWLAHPDISREQVARYFVDNVWASFQALRQQTRTANVQASSSGLA
ncbi:TetR/AcrR family transcriptional regulator [Virgisporangium ochraceum]|uniref:TetR family transcriptional regulator n=1 Tax=Virgisporangium ochraceum TaxID=65505 RepID=A0A8J4A1D0_9ACTN|nr:TetR/AcrR family transcriptional regulator [Virgisporangium ochraceum]GIJ72120.1 TetR family transcriptional regulator [Virgisporangium ochraceum]